MDTRDLTNLIFKAPFGYALHKILLNDDGTPVDYEFIEVNPTFEKLTGLKASHIVQKKVTEVIPGIPHDRFDWIGFYGEIALTGKEKEFEQYSEALGRWYKVQVYSPEKYYFITTLTDITDRLEAEEALRRSEERYQKAQEVGHVGSWEYDIKNDTFWGSDEGNRIYGFNVTTDIFSAEEVMKCVIDRERVNQALVDLIQKTIPIILNLI